MSKADFDRQVPIVAETWRPTYQPAFQGIRAIAVLSVFAFHVGTIPQGWLGVEVFFVLSGFIITLPILQECQEGTFSFRRFYVRRLGRLLPASLITVLAATCYAVVTDLSVEMHLQAAIASLLYFANIVMASGGEMGLLGHIWSLSLEEQFYFLWPVVLLATVRRGGVKWVVAVALAGFVTSALLRAGLTSSEGWWDRVYYGVDTRAGGLLAGCLAGALVFATKGMLSKRVPLSLLWALLVTVGAAMIVMDGKAESTWTYFVTAFDVAVAVILIGLYDRRAVLARHLAVRPLLVLGDMSYSIYLWHLPIIAAVGYSVSLTLPRMALQVLLPFAAAALSYYVVEQPTRAWVKKHTEPSARLPLR